jgi:hypothetical protein
LRRWERQPTLIALPESAGSPECVVNLLNRWTKQTPMTRRRPGPWLGRPSSSIGGSLVSGRYRSTPALRRAQAAGVSYSQVDKKYLVESGVSGWLWFHHRWSRPGNPQSSTFNEEQPLLPSQLSWSPSFYFSEGQEIELRHGIGFR